jgi:hypothetical protein
MGYERMCTLTYEGSTTNGTALLEQKDLIFRGPSRLAIPLASVASAIARDGVLRVRFDDRTADFALGDAAEKWASRITNPPSRLDKLGIKKGMRVGAVGLADKGFLDEVAARGARIVRSAAARPVDVIFYGANHRDALARLADLAKRLQPDGALWVVRPKGRPEITEAETMAAGKRAGLVDVKVVSFSESHTAEKFVIPVARRKAARKSR